MELNSKIKIDLLKLLDKSVIYDSKNISVSNCMKSVVANYQSICLSKCEELILFEL